MIEINLFIIINRVTILISDNLVLTLYAYICTIPLVLNYSLIDWSLNVQLIKVHLSLTKSNTYNKSIKLFKMSYEID